VTGEAQGKGARRFVWTAIPAVAILAAGTFGYLLMRTPTSLGYGSDAMAMECRFDSYCRGEACAGALPEVAQIVINANRGRSAMIWDRPLGQATVLQGETETVYAAQIEQDIWAVFVLSAERAFTFRKTEQRIDAAGFETGSGQCSAPAPLPEAS
jgi:hypothetical protein